MAGCPWDTRPVSRHKCPFLWAFLSLASKTKSLGTPAGRPLFVPPGVPETPGKCPEDSSWVDVPFSSLLPFFLIKLVRISGFSSLRDRSVSSTLWQNVLKIQLLFSGLFECYFHCGYRFLFLSTRMQYRKNFKTLAVLQLQELIVSELHTPVRKITYKNRQCKTWCIVKKGLFISCTQGGFLVAPWEFINCGLLIEFKGFLSGKPTEKTSNPSTLIVCRKWGLQDRGKYNTSSLYIVKCMY